MIAFKSHCVTYQNDGGVVLLGFADDEMNTTEYLMLQRSLQPDQQDQALGHDTVHIELNSPDKSGYGGVRVIRFDGTTVYVELNENFAQQIGTNIIKIDVSKSGISKDTLKDHLSKLVGEDPILELV